MFQHLSLLFRCFFSYRNHRRKIFNKKLRGEVTLYKREKASEEAALKRQQAADEAALKKQQAAEEAALRKAQSVGRGTIKAGVGGPIASSVNNVPRGTKIVVAGAAARMTTFELPSLKGAF